MARTRRYREGYWPISIWKGGSYVYVRDKNGRDGHWQYSTPSDWTRLQMNVPRRRKNKRDCKKVLQGADVEGMWFELGNHKPHSYYW